MSVQCTMFVMGTCVACVHMYVLVHVWHVHVCMCVCADVSKEHPQPVAASRSPSVEFEALSRLL